MNIHDYLWATKNALDDRKPQKPIMAIMNEQQCKALGIDPENPPSHLTVTRINLDET